MPKEEGFYFKKLFAPLTTSKAIHWIVIIGIIVFFNSFFNGFVWDDKIYILNNPGNLNIFYLFGPNMFNDLFYRPLSAAYFSLLYAVFGTSAFYYHFFQVSLHIINTILLFFIFKKFIKKHFALILSLIFLVHPIQVESAIFLSTALTPLSMFFGSLALVLSLNDKITTRRFILISLFLIVSLLVKETGAIFLVLVLTSRVLFHFDKKTIMNFVFIDVLIGCIYLFLRYAVGGVYLSASRIDIVPISTLTIFERLLSVPAIIFYYLKTFVFPNTLAIDQQWVVTTAGFWNFFFPLFVDLFFFLSCFILGIYLFQTSRKIFKFFLLFFIWFLLGLVFLLQIFPLDMTVADRFFYFPIVGLLGIIGACLNLLKPLANNRKLKLIGYISVIVVIILLSVRSIVRNGNWYDELTLYSHDSKIYDSSGIETNLGADYFSKQDYKNALVHFEKSVDILPSELNLFNVGLGYETMGNLQKARYFYQKALLLKKYPTDKHKSIEINTIQRLAFVYLLSNENETARKFVQQQLTEFPKNGLLLEYLAISEYRLNNYSQALNDVIKAKQYISNKEIDYVYTQINTKQTIQIH